MPDISIIIATRQRNEIFRQTLAAAVNAIENLNAEIIVVNDFPEEKINYDDSRVKIADNPGRGVSSARNHGAEIAASPLLLFIDNDILINAENVRSTIAVHAAHPHILLNANWEYPAAIKEKLARSSFGRVIRFWKLDSFRNRYSSFNGAWGTKLFKAKWPFAGFFFSIMKADFLAHGRFNTERIFGGEEEELSGRLAGKIEYWIDPQNIVYHNEYDKLTGYRNWLERSLVNAAQRAANRKSGWKGAWLRRLGFLVPVNYFILDHFPNHRWFDKGFARFLYFQALLLDNRPETT